MTNDGPEIALYVQLGLLARGGRGGAQDRPRGPVRAFRQQLLLAATPGTTKSVQLAFEDESVVAAAARVQKLVVMARAWNADAAVCLPLSRDCTLTRPSETLTGLQAAAARDRTTLPQWE